MSWLVVLGAVMVVPSSTSVRVRPATAEEQAFLELEDDEPVIEIFHTGWTADDRPVEVRVHSVPAYLWTSTTTGSVA